MPLVSRSLLKWILYFAIGPVLVLGLRWALPARSAGGPRVGLSLHQRFAGTALKWGAPQFIGCTEGTGAVMLRWKGEAKGEAASDPKDVARAQVKFLAGDSQTYRFRQELRMVPNVREARIEVLSKSINGNKITVRYSAEVPALYCGSPRAHEITSYLPIEPLALYAQMPMEQFWRGESDFRKVVRHPCVNSDLEPAPDAAGEFWAVWDPLRESMSEDGRKLFCQELLNNQMAPVKIAVEKATRDFQAWTVSSAANRPLAVKAYFIWNPQANEELRAEVWRRELVLKGSRWLAFLASTARGWERKNLNERDPALTGFAYFVEGLQEFINIDSEELSGDADHLRVLVKGRLREVESPIEMEIFLSNGDAVKFADASDLEILFSRETGARPFQKVVSPEIAPKVRAVFQPMGYVWTAPMKPAASTIWSSGYRLDARMPTILFRAWGKAQLGVDSEGRVFVAWPIEMQDSVLFD